MDFIEKYVKEHLATELGIIQASAFHTSINLTDYEKTIIYKYSDDGFRDINKVLRVSKGASFLMNLGFYYTLRSQNCPATGELYIEKFILQILS